MAERGNLQARLNEGIEAARAGDQANARRLLQQVISADPNNEVAWMWMASAVETPAERRACLERALEINPNNTRAREALRRLEAQDSAALRDSVNLEETEIRRARRLAAQGRRPVNGYLIAAALVLVFVVALVLIALINQTDGTPTPTSPPSTEVAAGASDAGAAAPTRVALEGAVVTLDAAAVTLPPAFTPTDTPTALPTATPTATPVPPSAYQFIYSGGLGGSPAGLHQVSGDGSQNAPVVPNGEFRDVALDPTGQRIAFVRASTRLSGEETETALPQLFVGPVDDPEAAVQITQLRGQQVVRPAWSPDGSRLAFASDTDGNLDIYIISRDGGDPVRLTNNAGVDTDPAWSPDGTLIAYASDQNSPPFNNIPGSPEIFTIAVDGGTPAQLTDATGDSTQPAWSPDGSRIVFISTRGTDPDVYIMDANGQGETLVTGDDSGAADSQPRFTPDGLYIAFISDRDGRAGQLFLTDLAGRTVLPVTQSDRAIQSLSVRPQSP